MAALRRRAPDGVDPARERELLILRTGRNCASDYEWHQHVRIALDSGLTEAEIERVRSGPDAEVGRRSTPRCCAPPTSSTPTAASATPPGRRWPSGYDEKQLIELCMLVGQYHLVAFTLNSLGVEIES